MVNVINMARVGIDTYISRQKLMLLKLLCLPFLQLQYGIAFDDDVDGIEHRAVLFDYVDDSVNVELDVNNKDRAVHWPQQKMATVDNGVNKELDVNNIVVAKGLVVAVGTSREDGVCFVDDVDDGVDEDDVVSSLRPSQFSQRVTW